MTPSAATAAGRATEPSRSYARSSSGLADPPRSPARTAERTHRRSLQPWGPAPRSPRRVSGPARGVVTEPKRRLKPARKPLTRRPPVESRPKPPAVSLPLPARIAAFVRALPDHRWLDRLVRGRVWIPLLGVLLTGIVAIQVEVLKLGASIGRSMTLATELQSRNQLLRASVAQLSDDQRIIRQATKLGMVMPGPTEVGFVAGHARDAVGKAVAGIRTPNSGAFLTALAAEEAGDGVTNPTLGTSGTPGAAGAASTGSNGAGTQTTTAPVATAPVTTTPVTTTPVSTTPATGATGTSGTGTGTAGTATVTPTATSTTGGAAAG